MPKFNLENYETVEDRLKKFWKDYPEGRIETEILHITPDGQCVTIQASVFKNEEDARPVATGIAQETKGQGGFANADAWMENAETSSLGRALSNWKFQGSKKPRPSAEEMRKVIREDTPKGPSKKEVAKITNDSANKFAEDIGAKKQPVAEQLNTILKEMIPNSKKMGEVKTKIYNDMVKDTEVSEDVNNWTNKDMDKFLNRVEVFLEDESLVDVVFDTQPVQDETKGDEMTDIPSGAWEQEPPTDKQLKTFNDKVAQATDEGQTELVKKAKDFLASGNATKKNIFDWIDTEGDWTLKDGS